MIKIVLQDGLPFVTASLVYRGQKITFDHILLDTGSASSIFPTDKLLDIGLSYEPVDQVHRIRGVGGAEFVFSKSVDELTLGELAIKGFEIEVGAMDYGLDLHGILGMDFLTQVGAVIDLNELEVVAGRN